MEFGSKLQKLRKDKGLSQEALAEMLGVSRQSVSKWESGGAYPEIEKLIILSEIFGVTLDSLVKGGEILKDEENPYAIPFWAVRGSVFEYKSHRTLFGLPLVHIHFGYGFKKAKGIIAIGNIASGVISIGMFSKGILAIGLFSMGIISIGCLSLGLLFALGSISIGIFSIGAVAVGIFSLGALSVGMFSAGALAAGSHIAIGDHAYGHIAVGRVAEGVRTFIDDSPRGQSFSMINAEEVKKAISEEYPNMWNWIIRLVISFL
jgi:transcriptional regulator with XRE-family HTH domain